MMIAVLVLVGLLALSERGRNLLWFLPLIALDSLQKKDWWASNGTVAFKMPPSLSKRVGTAPFHWRILVHRTSDGEASVVLCLTRTPGVLPDQPGRLYCHYGRMQEPGLEDRAVIQARVRLPWKKFSASWFKAIDGQWRLDRKGSQFSVTSIAVGQRIPLELDEEWFREVFAYHYWNPEDGPEPFQRDLPN